LEVIKMRKIILSLILILALSGIASATDWTYGNPTGLGYTNIISDQFVITNNNASTGSIRTVALSAFGFTETDRIQNCNNCLYGVINPIDSTTWGTDEQGNVFYTDLITPVDYSLGFYTLGIAGTCQSAGGNCNRLFKVGSFSATTKSRKLTFDSSGNVYGYDGIAIYKFVKSLAYTPQLFYTISGAALGSCDTRDSDLIIGLTMDISDNLYILLACRASSTAGFIYRIKITSDGIYTSKVERSVSGNTVAGTFVGGGLVNDVNPNNFTFAYYRSSPAVQEFLHYNSTAFSTVAALTGITDISDIGYNNFQIYLSSPSQNLIRSYVTNFEGYGFSSGAPANPEGYTGTFSWLNALGASVTTLTPGSALAYRLTVSNYDLTNYTFYAGWGYDTATMPTELRDSVVWYGNVPNIFPTSSNDVAGLSIYGYLLAKRNNDSSWSSLATPVKLTISPRAAGFDSITLDKSFYNLTGDTVRATFTYENGFPWIYGWQVCSRADCDDVSFIVPLIPGQLTSSLITTGLKQGNYFAVMTKKLPFLQSAIVDSQPFQIRPPIIGVSWDKGTYNLLPKTSISSCQDSTPSTSYFTTILGYAGLQKGFFSCPSVPADANANNSIMRGSLYAKYNGTFYLNNSLGNIWNGTLSNGSGSLIYVLTNTSPTETWTLQGINQSGEIFSANAQVSPADIWAYSLKISPDLAFNEDTLYLTFRKPQFNLLDHVILRDAGGQILAEFPGSDSSGTYYIDPNKQYTYGTWTAVWDLGAGQDILGITSGTTATVVVKNEGRPIVTPGVTPRGNTTGGETGADIADLLSSNLFWAFVFIFGSMGGIAVMVTGKSGNTQDAVLPAVIVGFFGLATFTFINWIPIWILASIILIAIVAFSWQQANKTNAGG